MLRSHLARTQGTVSPEIRVYAAGRIELLLCELVVSGIAMWRAENFTRYNDDEVCCTVRIHGCCQRFLEQNEGAWAQFRMHYETGQPTPEMLRGEAHPKRAPEPDLTISVGLEDFLVEAKKLGLQNSLPSNYVRRGMCRFIDGKYRTSASLGMMLGYLHDCGGYRTARRTP